MEYIRACWSSLMQRGIPESRAVLATPSSDLKTQPGPTSEGPQDVSSIQSSGFSSQPTPTITPEVESSVSAVGGLCATFKSTLDMLDHFYIGNDMPEPDKYAVFRVRLSTPQIRYTRWGKHAGLFDYKEGEKNDTLFQTDDDSQQAHDILKDIERTFLKAQEQCTNAPNGIEDDRPATHGLSEFAYLHRDRVDEADKVEEALPGANWAIVNKLVLDELTAELGHCLEQLQLGWPEPQLVSSTQRWTKLAQKDLQVITGVADDMEATLAGVTALRPDLARLGPTLLRKLLAVTEARRSAESIAELRALVPDVERIDPDLHRAMVIREGENERILRDRENETILGMLNNRRADGNASSSISARQFTGGQHYIGCTFKGNVGLNISRS